MSERIIAGTVFLALLVLLIVGADDADRRVRNSDVQIIDAVVVTR